MNKKTSLIMMIAFVIMTGQGICAGIDWKSYNEGVRLAKQQDKKIFLHFRTDWCGYCAKMESSTFKDPEITEILNDYFISIKVDGDKEKSLTKRYGVRGYPDNRFFDENSKEIRQMPGFVEPQMFLFFLKYIQTDSYKTMDPMEYYKSK